MTTANHAAIPTALLHAIAQGGQLPKSQKWTQVVDLLDTAPDDAAKIAGAVMDAADHRLRNLSSDPSLGFSFWLLTLATHQSDLGRSATRLEGIS